MEEEDYSVDGWEFFERLGVEIVKLFELNVWNTEGLDEMGEDSLKEDEMSVFVVFLVHS